MRWWMMLVVAGALDCTRSALPVPRADGGGEVTDLAERSDLAAPPDLAQLPVDDCNGPPIAGTCVATFFAPMLACFQPSGACQQSTGPAGSINLCFASGSKIFGIPPLGAQSEVGWMGSKQDRVERDPIS
jgi:hypothetical protein